MASARSFIRFGSFAGQRIDVRADRHLICSFILIGIALRLIFGFLSLGHIPSPDVVLCSSHKMVQMSAIAAFDKDVSDSARIVSRKFALPQCLACFCSELVSSKQYTT